MSTHLPLHYWSVAQLRQAYSSGAVSPAEATQACLDRIERLDPYLHAFLLTLTEQARAQARGLSGNRLHATAPMVAGIPYAIKDNFDIKGLPTTCHSQSRADHIATQDSEAYGALKEAGAVLLGKNSMHELATGGPAFDLPWPPARNPWNTRRHPGGSSSGSGVAVATGMACFALGTDTSGSVRHPATACGIVGFKPTYDAISSHGIVPLSRSLDHPGVLARSSLDVAAVMEVVGSGHAERQRYAQLAREGVPRRLRGYRVGVIGAFSTDLDADPEIMQALHDMLAGLKQAGCTLVPLQVDPLATYAMTARTLIGAEAYMDHGAALEANPQHFCVRTRARIGKGKECTAEQFAALREEQRRLSSQLQQAMSGVDVAITLSSLHFPCSIDDEAAINTTYDRQARTPFNLAGMPALAVPAGQGSNALPLGLQFAANVGADVALLEFGAALEAEGLSRFVPPPDLQ